MQKLILKITAAAVGGLLIGGALGDFFHQVYLGAFLGLCFALFIEIYVTVKTGN